MSTVVTNTDLLDAANYAANILDRYVIEKFIKSYPAQSSNITITTAQWTPDDLPSIVNSSVDQIRDKNTIEFTQTGCDLINCLPIQYTGDTCLPDTAEQTWESIDPVPQQYTSCQSACYGINKKYDQSDPYPTMVPTVWKENQCRIRNIYSITYALAPSRRSDNYIGGTTNTPLFSLGDEDKILITQQYCTFFGTQFRDGDCYRPLGERILEILLFGRTLSALILHAKDITYGRLDYYTQLISISKLKTTLYNSNNQVYTSSSSNTTSLSNTPNISTVESNSFWSAFFSVENILEILASLGFDYITEKILDGFVNIIKKTIKTLSDEAIFRLLLNGRGVALLRATLEGTIIRRGVVDLALSSTRSIAINLLKMATSVIRFIDFVLIVVGVASFILDIIDPFDLNRQLFQKQCDLFTAQFDLIFRSTFQSLYPTLSPVSVLYMSRLKPDEDDDTSESKVETDDEFVESFTYISDYLLSLKRNSLGQILDWTQDEPSTNIQPPIPDQIDRELILPMEKLELRNSRNRIYVQKNLVTSLPIISLLISASACLYGKETIGIVFLIVALILSILQILFVDTHQYSYTRCINFFSSRQGLNALDNVMNRLTMLDPLQQFKSYKSLDVLETLREFPLSFSGNIVA